MAKKNKTATIGIPKIFCVLEEIVANNSAYSYKNIPSDWKNKDIFSFAKGMNLYDPEQTKALENIASVLYLTFNGATDGKPDLTLLQSEYDKYIAPAITYQLNRACFWMATGSGKTLVLIKTIEYIDYLMTAGLIPKKEIMLLLPTRDLIAQFQEQISKYNLERGKKIKEINLLEYENDKSNNSLNFGEIKVYYCRSDLMRNERKESIINYETYLNGGNWYLFLDEAHRGDSENSNLKDYVNKLTQNGFLFNFSATFIDDIDILTACYNFNLEKFITSGYGKNIYLSESTFTKQKENNQFTSAQKQKEFLKSFIIYTLIKRNKNSQFYHNPLMITLANSVNAKSGIDSDLSEFCKIMFAIANNAVSKSAFADAINELKFEFAASKDYVFQKEQLTAISAIISEITIIDIIKEAFNAANVGNIEFYDCGNGEIVFMLTTASEPFALIRIGDTAAFIKNYLSGYNKITSYTIKNWFAELNEPKSTINILLGSRAFYEGWDSNRPNVINFINIGKGDAKKYVPQSIGRGVRIQPDAVKPNERKRLSPIAPATAPVDPNKNELLETLFVFATDGNSVDKILTSITELSGSSTSNQSLYLKAPDLFSFNADNIFDLLIPTYKKSAIKSVTTSAQFEIESGCQSRFEETLNSMSPAVFLLQSHKSFADTWSLRQYKELKDAIAKKSIFTNITTKNYQNYNFLASDLRKHICTEEREIDKIRIIGNTPPDEDIVHFKHITTALNSAEEGNLIRFMGGALPTIFGHSSGNVNIHKLTEHYYFPLLYADTDKVNYINHIIKIESEIIFIKNLIAFLNKGKAFLDAKNTKEKDYSASEEIISNWMFSKIDETLDKNMGMPYFEDNAYKYFFPDFIFWLKKDNDYKIVFVDPKGIKHTDYQKKIDGFEKLFLNGTVPKIFLYKDKDKDYSITFELKLVYTGTPAPTGKYASYWIPQGDFSFLWSAGVSPAS